VEDKARYLSVPLNL